MSKCDVTLYRDFPKSYYKYYTGGLCLFTLHSLGICIQTFEDGFFMSSSAYWKVFFFFFSKLALVFISRVTHMSH